MSEYSELTIYHLNNILAEVETIIVFTEGYDYQKYVDDLKTSYAVERALLNVSETVRRIESAHAKGRVKTSLNDISPEIPWQKIKGIGNILRHNYDNVSANEIWYIVEHDLNSLKQACIEALEKIQGS